MHLLRNTYICRERYFMRICFLNAIKMKWFILWLKSKFQEKKWKWNYIHILDHLSKILIKEKQIWMTKPEIPWLELAVNLMLDFRYFDHPAQNSGLNCNHYNHQAMYEAWVQVLFIINESPQRNWFYPSLSPWRGLIGCQRTLSEFVNVENRSNEIFEATKALYTT